MHPGEAGFAAPNFSDLEATLRDARIRATTPDKLAEPWKFPAPSVPRWPDASHPNC
jgi:hypothetical protein